MDEPASTKKLLIGVVGPCAAGKSTLIAGLTRLGYRTRHIAQEHSYVKDMWQRLTNPDILVFLDASYPTTCQRRKLDWTRSGLAGTAAATQPCPGERRPVSGYG